MLKGIDPILTPEVLYALSAMGHGDTVAIVDANFPADAIARSTLTGRSLRLSGSDTREVFRAILSLLVVDTFSDPPIVCMAPSESGEGTPNVQTEALQELSLAEGSTVNCGTASREEFYAAAKNCFCVIVTGELRPWGCFILTKGVLLAEDEVILAQYR